MKIENWRQCCKTIVARVPLTSAAGLKGFRLNSKPIGSPAIRTKDIRARTILEAEVYSAYESVDGYSW